MPTTRTQLNRPSLVLTDEMIELFKRIRKMYRGYRESPSSELVDAHNRLQVLFNLTPCHPSPALCPAVVDPDANDFLKQCHSESLEICRAIEQAIADERRRSRQRASA